MSDTNWGQESAVGHDAAMREMHFKISGVSFAQTATFYWYAIGIESFPPRKILVVDLPISVKTGKIENSR